MKCRDQVRLLPKLSILGVAISLLINQGALAQQPAQLPQVVVVGTKLSDLGVSLDGKNLNTRRFASNDAASLLDGVPGVSLFTGGGISSLPSINGLADDRLKITVDGMSITSACPNHMNPALSYLDPSALSQISVFAGIVPVSQGGDSIGGAIVAKSAAPVFAQAGEGIKTSGNISAFHRSNGNVTGLNLLTNAATEKFALAYTGNMVEAHNYKDGNGLEVAASRYKVRNSSLKFATTSGTDLWTMALGWQDIPFQGYPNQSMDMTSNKSVSINAGYNGNFDWGLVEARIFRQNVRHKMDVLSDKAAAAGFPQANSYMPMDTDAADLGYSVLATVQLGNQQIVRFGQEFHQYRLDDWWPPLVGSGAMEPNTFWNVNGGRRERVALFSELETYFSDKLSTQFGVRVEQVKMNAGKVQGYYEANSAFGDAYQSDAAAFNLKDRHRKDLNLDLTASARYASNANEIYDIGVMRKTRSPNLHERYTWSNEAMMAGLMNNWFGDLNSYVGNTNLKPEVAYSLKAAAHWQDSERQTWQVKFAPFYTYVRDYINAIPNTSANPYNMSGIAGRQSLTFANQDAYLYGVDASGKLVIAKNHDEWALRAAFSYTRGKTTNGGNLYNLMPVNARLALDHSSNTWSNSVEAVFVGAKENLDTIRAEQRTAGYALVNYRVSYNFNAAVRFDAGLDNLLNKQYNMALGGLEYVTGGMASAPKPVRATGRSLNLGVSVSF